MNTFPPPITEATVIETTGREVKPKRSRGLVIGLVIIGICVVALAAVGIATAGTTTALHGSAAPVLAIPTTTAAPTTTVKPKTDIEQAASTCGMTANVEDNGHSISMDTQGDDEYSGDRWEDVDCVTNRLNMTASVNARVMNTRALDGMQTATWGAFTATWNFHPDNGLFLVIEDSTLG